MICADGIWSLQSNTLKCSGCAGPPDGNKLPAYSSWTCTGVVAPGGTCTAKCDTYFTAEGSLTASCNANGTWATQNRRRAAKPVQTASLTCSQAGASCPSRPGPSTSNLPDGSTWNCPPSTPSGSFCVASCPAGYVQLSQDPVAVPCKDGVFGNATGSMQCARNNARCNSPPPSSWLPSRAIWTCPLGTAADAGCVAACPANTTAKGVPPTAWCFGGNYAQPTVDPAFSCSPVPGTGTCKVQPTADDMPTNAWKSSVWSCKLPMLDGETCIAACANTSASASAADPPQLKCSANSNSSRWDYVKGACSPPPPPGSTTIVFGGFATTVKDYDGHNVYYMVEAGGSADRVMNVFTIYGNITNPYGVAVVSSHLYIAGFDAGIREVGDMDWHPVTRDLCFTDSPREGLSQPAAYELNCIPWATVQSLSPQPVDFGFPYCHTVGSTSKWSAVADPDVNRRGEKRDCSSGSNVKPVLAFEASKEPIGIRFYTINCRNGTWQGFQDSYNNSAFIAEHGIRSGRIVAVDLTGTSGNMVASNYRSVVTGWELPVSPKNITVTANSPGWGRPISLDFLLDGTMLVADDATGAVYRITPAPAEGYTAEVKQHQCRDKSYEPVLQPISAAETARFPLHSAMLMFAAVLLLLNGLVL
ncbi:hypothetical protein OEZ85_004715 [Tetradesmus obliquus]|uniref:G-protein coupled receptors family 2 profile 1 domain-containing protein n=1 Tax=Tetradesmus obliquus TaxID=3088 RepID=A0ABY8UM01_TETOB|nr:hypothetical protein OEZ85_004715 [Tetradesmus obliquus]